LTLGDGGNTVITRKGRAAMPREREVAIVGVFATTQQLHSGQTTLGLMMQAIARALDDAGLAMRDVDGFLSSHFAGGNGLGRSDSNVAHQFGQPFGLVGEWSGAPAVLVAAAAIRQGIAEVVVVPTSAVQAVEPGKTSHYTRPTFEFTEFTGSMTPAQFALIARRHMHEFGTTREQLAYTAATIRNNGHKNPKAVMVGRGPYTVERVLAAPMVADPFTRLMCSIANDGGSCFVVASAERARDCRHPPIWVLGGAMETRTFGYFEAPSLEMTLSRPRMVEGFRRAGIEHDDTDIVMVYDHFAHATILQLETLGFCAPGEGGAYAQEVMGLDQKHPVCPDGGNLSYSHNMEPHNFKIIEIVRQFRNDVPDLCPDWAQGVHTYDRVTCRKVREPKLAVACGPLTEGRHSFVLLGKD
jgi:acetyl-CoA acetyltransferase